MNQPAMANLKTLAFGGAGPVADPDLTKSVYDAIRECCDQNVLEDLTVQSRFLDCYQQWIRDSRSNSLQGLDQFTVAAYANGTTEGFDKFMLRNHGRRFRCFRGEYMYHPAAWRNYFPEWCRIEDAPLADNDAVVMSMPFSDTGEVHPDAMSVLDQCDRLGIPVLIDSAFFGICHDIEFDYDRECVTDITFSLSKTFPVANLRIGMRLTRHDDDDGLMVHNKTRYVNRVACGLGTVLLDRVSPDWVYLQYRPRQLEFVNKLGVESSQCVIFGLGGEAWQHYNRGTATNRLSFHRWLPSGQLPE